MNDETKTETMATPRVGVAVTRRSKIARLPAEVREELNQRLLDGEMGAALLQWLNELPEVQAVLQKHFGGRPVTDQNLSEWRQGGFRDWLAKMEAAEWMADTLADVPGLSGKGGGQDGKPDEKGAEMECAADRVAAWFFPHYVAAARARLVAAETTGERWSVLRDICADLAALRRSEHYVERLRMWREKLELESEAQEGITEEKVVQWARAQEDIERLIWPDRKKLTPEERKAEVRQILGLPKDWS